MTIYKHILIFVSLFALASCSEHGLKRQRTAGPDLKRERVSGGDTLPKVPVLEGVINGGGGKGVLCDTSHGKTLEVLDLYVGKKTYSLEYDNFNTEEEALDFATRRTNYQLSDGSVPPSELNIQKDLKQDMADDIKIEFTDEPLKLTKDAGNPTFEDGCEEVQIAIYFNESTLLINKKLWGMLDKSPLQKTALYLHEILYHRFRNTRDHVDSIFTQKLVAHLLAKKPMTPAFKVNYTEEKQPIYSCRGDSYLAPGTDDYFISTVYHSFDSTNSQGLEFVLHRFLGQIALFRQNFFLYNQDLRLFDSSGVPASHAESHVADVYIDTYSQFKYKAKVTLPPTNTENHYFDLEFLDFKTNESINKYKLICNEVMPYYFRKIENRGTDDSTQFLDKIKPGKYTTNDTSYKKLEITDDKKLIITEESPNSSFTEVCTVVSTVNIEHILARDTEFQNKYYSEYGHEFVMSYESVEITSPELSDQLEQKDCEVQKDTNIHNYMDELQHEFIKIIDDNKFQFSYDNYTYEMEP